MAEKTYEIEVKTTSDTSGITSVQDALKQAKEEAEETKQALEEAFSNATEEVTELESALSEAELNGDQIEAERIAEELSDAREKAEELETELNNFDATRIENITTTVTEYGEATEEATSSTENLGITISNIDPSVIDQLREAMGEYSNTAQESADSTNDLMEGLVSGGVATGLGNTFMGLASKAGDYNDSMLRMGLALEGHAMTVEQVSAKYGSSVKKMAEETGRGAGSVRNHYSNMAVAGVKSSDTLESSFQAIANGSFYSGESIESLSNKFQRITMTGMLSAKQLSSLGLTMDDLAQVMGVSADEVSNKFKEMSAEQRASVMSQASSMKYGTEVNDVFKQSWEGLWTQMDKASAGLQRLVGELLLPYLIPAVETAITIVDGLTETFKMLPQPVKDLLGGFLTLGTAISTLGLGLNAVMKIGKMVISPFQTIAKLMGIDTVESAKKLATTLQTNLTKGFDAVKKSVRDVANSLKTNLKNAFKNVGDYMRGTFIPRVKDVANSLKTTMLNAFKSVKNFFTTQFIPTLRNVATSLINVGKQALTSGYNALKSAVMWAVDKASKLASAVANGIAEASQWALNLAMSMNPVMIIVTAILILIGVLAYLYFNNEQVRQAVDGLGQAFMQVGQIIWGFLVQAYNTVISTLQSVWNYIMTLGGLLPANTQITGNKIIDSILKVIMFIATLPVQLAIIFANAIAKALGFGNNFVQNMIKAGSQSVSNFISYISQIPGKLATELGNALNKVEEWASTLPQKFWDAGVNAVKNFLSALGIASPGTMQRMLVWEVTEMGKRVPYESRTLLSNVSQMGRDVVDEFGNPQLSVGIDDKVNFANGSVSSEGNTGQVINFYFEDVVIDNEERMDRIVDYVRRELAWNNKTAGRTV